MKVAIHSTEGSFSERWIEYCEKFKIAYKIVNAYDSNIMDSLEDCDVFLWHHHHANYKDTLFAKQLLYSLQIAGKKVFPDFNTGWHFDDKVGQKYLLEAIGAPFVPSYVFYDRQEALNWVNSVAFPKVFKLRGGAGASNVKLVPFRSKAKKIIRRAFGRGFSQYDGWGSLKERYRQYRAGTSSVWDVVKGMVRLVVPTEFARMHGREKGYVYFQNFIEGNTCDIRVIVIGNKAFAFKRLCRENDFRASGSGNFVYEKEEINEACVKIAFEVNKKIKSQCIAYDFVFDKGVPLIVELSYGFTVHVYDDCQGYWTEDMVWHEGSFKPQYWMIENLLKTDRQNLSVDE